MIEFIQSGGAFMYLILALSVVAVAIIIERYYVLQFSYKHKDTFFEAVLKAARRSEFQAAKLLCDRTNHPLAKVMTVILNHPSASIEALESVVDLEIQKVAPKIQSRTHFLQMIGSVATLVGLLGTIRGLIISFMSLSSADAAAKAELLAKGISTAMNTTAFGLIVAIPCIVAYSVLTNKENKILQKYNEVVTEIIHILVYEVGTSSSAKTPKKEKIVA